MNAFDVMADHLRRLVQGLEGGKGTTGGSPASGSPASLLARDRTFSAGWGDAPGLDLANYARLLVVSANDHMMTFADSLQSTTSGIYSSYTLARGMLEAASRAWYLTEPSLDPHERIRRYMNDKLWAFHESRMFLKGMGRDSHEMTAAEQKISKSAETFNYHAVPAKGLKPAYLDQPQPKIMDCIDQAVVAAASAGFGKTVYRYLSAVAHGTEMGLAGALLPESPENTVMTFSKTSEQQARHFIIPLMAYTLMAERFLGYFGWDTARWDTARQNTLEFWVGHATQGVSETQDASAGEQ